MPSMIRRSGMPDMTTRAEWVAIAERCERAAGADRELDAEIAVGCRLWLETRYAVSGLIDPLWRADYDGLFSVLAGPAKMPVCTREAPLYTASLDAIVSLIERELPDPTWRLLSDCGRAFAFINIDHYLGEAPGVGWHTQAATPALALCSAFAKAKAEGAER